METIETISAYLRRSGWLEALVPEGGDPEVGFLAAGEYNENHLVCVGGHRFVFRVNHGSQLGLDNQVEYEFTALAALADSGVTPRPFFMDPVPDILSGGVLLMEYLPGRPLDYRRDTDRAARIFARVHTQPLGRDAKKLLVQAHPVRDIADECYGLLTRYPDHPRQEDGSKLLAFHETIERLARDTEAEFASEPLVVVNTEVNSHNFLMSETGDGGDYLVDWEKAVLSPRYQDLGHFLVPTTTLWKSGYRYSEQEKQAFLREYLRAANLDLDFEEVLHKTRILERTILLRGLSWCYMAFFEYTRHDRAIKNRDTFDKITQYLDGIECFVK